MDETDDEELTDVARARLAQQAVAFVFGEAGEELTALSRRTSTMSRARQIAMYLVHVAFGMSLGRVALAFRRDRSTVSYACRVVEDHREDEAFDDCLDRLEEFLRAAPPRPRRPPRAQHRGGLKPETRKAA
jgi:chromosomal replication initiation ATPase DnaA